MSIHPGTGRYIPVHLESFRFTPIYCEVVSGWWIRSVSRHGNRSVLDRTVASTIYNISSAETLETRSLAGNGRDLPSVTCMFDLCLRCCMLDRCIYHAGKREDGRQCRNQCEQLWNMREAVDLLSSSFDFSIHAPEIANMAAVLDDWQLMSFTLTYLAESHAYSLYIARFADSKLAWFNPNLVYQRHLNFCYFKIDFTE